MSDNQKLREALKYLRDASREFHHLILNSKHNEICDKYKYAEVAKISDAIANANAALSMPSEPVGNNAKMREVLKHASERLRKATESERYGEDVLYLVGCMRSVAQECDHALSAPPRNCDKCLTPKDAMLAHLAEVYEGEKVEFGDYEWCEFVKWLFAEAKGGGK